MTQLYQEKVHVYPTNDLAPHIIDDERPCWCAPEPDILDPSVLVHGFIAPKYMKDKRFITGYIPIILKNPTPWSTLTSDT